jgi:tRNA(Arg) A34 adenosine deaminase TadA
MKKSLLTDAIRIAQSKKERHNQRNHYMIWSFVVVDNKIIEYGENHSGVPSDPMYRNRSSDNFKSKTHAECAAWFKAKGLIGQSSFEMINVRLTKTGKLKLSAPCPCCRNFLSRIGCKNVYFTLDEGGWGKTVF